MAKQQEIAPQLKELQKKYSSKDTETQTKLRDETQKLYASAGVNPVMGCLPIVIQMPFLIALYQAILRTSSLQSGTFLWMNLSQPDPLWIMQILATLFTLGTSILSMMAQPTRNSSSWVMMIISPAMIFVFSVTLPSALAIYWVVTNAFSMVQQLLIQNPFKIRREREEKARAEKEKERALRKAYKKATKRRK
jgi:YidC/Oxa1 family membrane protein insertase